MENVKNLKGEIWKDVVGYDGLYVVSNMGRLASCNKYAGRRGEWKLLSPMINEKRGYLYVALQLCGKRNRKNHILHRLVANAFIPNPQNKVQVNHKNGIKTDNMAKNLEWCTAKENAGHAVNAGLYNPPSGERNWKAKLTEHEIKRIRLIKSIDKKMTNTSIARLFNVRQQTISSILLKQTWKHVI